MVYIIFTRCLARARTFEKKITYIIRRRGAPWQSERRANGRPVRPTRSTVRRDGSALQNVNLFLIGPEVKYQVMLAFVIESE